MNENYSVNDDLTNYKLFIFALLLQLLMNPKSFMQARNFGGGGAEEINFHVCFALTLDVVRHSALSCGCCSRDSLYGMAQTEISSCADNTPAHRSAIMRTETSQLTKNSCVFLKVQITNHSNKKNLGLKKFVSDIFKEQYIHSWISKQNESDV
jgi:hypothetical protein